MRAIPVERLSELAYGTVVALVTVSGLAHADPHPTWWKSVLVVLAGGVAICLAHTYSSIIGRRFIQGRRLTAREFFHELRESWHIVTAAALIGAPLALVGLGLAHLETAFTASRVLGVMTLGLMGLFVPNETNGRRVFLAIVSACVGAGIVALEIAVHR